MRAVETPHARVLHLINLTGQTETGWDTPKQLIRPIQGAVVRLRREQFEPKVFAASPAAPVPAALVATQAGDGDEFALPPLAAWTMLLIQRR